jgi:hypothetical protein
VSTFFPGPTQVAEEFDAWVDRRAVYDADPEGWLAARRRETDAYVREERMNGVDAFEALLEVADPLDRREAAFALKAFDLRVSHTALNIPVAIEEPDPASHMTLGQMETGVGVRATLN